MTVAFEFGFGHWVDGDSWSALLENYDITAGKIWVLVPIAMATGPELARRLTRSELSASATQERHSATSNSPCSGSSS